MTPKEKAKSLVGMFLLNIHQNGFVDWIDIRFYYRLRCSYSSIITQVKNNFKMADNDHLWRQFIRLGEMIGDGLHHEEPWISKEYKHLAMILCPPTPEEKKHRKDSIDAQMTNLLKDHRCSCGGIIKQSRSGSKTAYCEICNARYKAKSKKN